MRVLQSSLKVRDEGEAKTAGEDGETGESAVWPAGGERSRREHQQQTVARGQTVA